MKIRLLALLAVLVAANCTFARELSAPKSAEGDTTKPGLVKIAGSATMDSPAFQLLTELSDEIGSRVTGSPEARKAVEWSAAKMKSIGLENVHTEKWNLWKGWTRGPAEAMMLAPLHRPLAISAMGWTGSTPAGGVDADPLIDHERDAVVLPRHLVLARELHAHRLAGRLRQQRCVI